MAVHVVDTDADDGGGLGGEIFQRLVEAGDFGRTDERKISWIKKDQDQFGVDLREARTCDAPVDDAGKIEGRCRIAWLQHREC